MEGVRGGSVLIVCMYHRRGVQVPMTDKVVHWVVSLDVEYL